MENFLNQYSKYQYFISNSVINNNFTYSPSLINNTQRQSVYNYVLNTNFKLKYVGMQIKSIGIYGTLTYNNINIGNAINHANCYVVTCLPPSSFTIIGNSSSTTSLPTGLFY